MSAMSRSTLVSIPQIRLTGCLFAAVLTSESTIIPPRKRLSEAIIRSNEHETRAGRPQQQPAPPVRELVRECVKGEDDDDEQRAQRLEELHSRL
jgi:hypothetical protein